MFTALAVFLAQLRDSSLVFKIFVGIIGFIQDCVLIACLGGNSHL